MRYAVALVIAACLASLPSASASADEYQETRCCVEEIKRDSEGNILRSWKAKYEFRKRWPCPTGASLYDLCDGWQIDHVIPLSVGGYDSVSNMQWLPVEIKTCAGDFCKDRWERKIYRQQ